MAMLPNPLPRLADDLSGAALGLRLPPGRLVDTTFDGPWHEPLLWQADNPAAPDSWRELLAARTAGLLPVLLETGAIPGGEDVTGWELDPGMMSYPGDHDAEEFLAHAWPAAAENDDTSGAAVTEPLDGTPVPDPAAGTDDVPPNDATDDLVAPFGTDFPGLAPGLLDPADAAAGLPDTVAAELTAELTRARRLHDPRAALVYARRSADIPAAIGWTGPINHENDVALLCAVLRSWEDRFGLRVVALGFDTLTATVAVPPATVEDAEAVAAEHLSFCPDNITQNGPGTLRGYAKSLLDAQVWQFWWD
ncbi:protein of unknown function [Actinacidiphila yanglinensis]|uniref:DUF4253 domain-containing protein n=1 Tax=Actinacidiphila yanglinensis TaxID=310779 RepID=A0A1H6BYM8_9ACTN|nr:DUF4253 domain-containing protein [Actinacidiphila yanglinensis]SEG65801.1 protein of unknown function [Actinacidiphila yanglinensis]